MDLVAIWVQAISSVILVIVTMIYVRHTKKLVEESSNAFVCIEKFEILNLSGCLLIVTNCGPGHALNLEITVEMNNLEKTLDGEEIKTQWVKTVGSRILVTGKNEKYEISEKKLFAQNVTPVIVSYNTQTGKTFKYKWLINVGKRPEIEFIGEWE